MPEPHTPQDQPKRLHLIRNSIILAAFIFILALWGIFTRIHAENALHQSTIEQSIPLVNVIVAKSGNNTEELTLPADIQAWHETPIYARTNGYVKSWKVDIGTRVKAGDLLAELDTPDIDAQLNQSKANLVSAEANNTLAQSTAKRWQSLYKNDLVSKQETEEKAAAANASAAKVLAAKADLDRLQQLVEFKRIVAPFDGVVTVRNTDIGALINAGSSSSAGQELFKVAETSKLRAYVRVPENYARAINKDLKSELFFSQYPGRAISATLGESASAIDPETRTLLIQLVIENSSGEYLPGSYAEAHLEIPADQSFIHLPVNTLLFRDGTKIVTIENGKTARLKNVSIGRDYGKYVEITNGISAGETIVVNPPDSLIDGEEVKIITPEKTENKGK